MTEDDVYGDLERAAVPYEKLEHAAVFTVEESAAIHAALPEAAHTKNLFLRDRRGGHWLFVLPSDRRADLKAFAEATGAGKFSFGKEDEMGRLLGVSPGAVTPIAAPNAPAGSLQVVFDETLRSRERIAVHPLRNTATLVLPFGGLLTWLSGQGVDAQVINLP